MIVAIVGMPGAGKSELAKLFCKKGYRMIRFGELTEKELAKRSLLQDFRSEKLVREDLRKRYGMEAYAAFSLKNIKKAKKEGNVVIDGLYSWEEYLYLKKRFRNEFFLIAIHSSRKLRYQRLSKRKERRLSEREAYLRDRAEIENLNKAGPIAFADYHIINEGSLSDLKREFEKVFLKINL
jgi:dephospho-CoA kinase